MQFSPLAHGASGIFDEVILFAEAVLVLALLISFFRSRGKGRTNPPTPMNHKDTKTQGKT